jgi:hypothetical protein
VRSSSRVAGFVAVAVVAALLPGEVAGADSPTILYVRAGTGCSDTGPGTKAEPYCTVQHAADVVDPGETVLIDGTGTNIYREGVVISRSGTPDAPIVFSGGVPNGAFRTEIFPQANQGPGVTMIGVHDVRLDHLDIAHRPGQEGIHLQGVHGVALDLLTVRTLTGAGNVGGPGNGVTIDGSSSDVTVSRTTTTVDAAAYGVQAMSGSARITVTTNAIRAEGGAVRLTGVSGVAVTNNSLSGSCGPMIGVDGASSAVVVENNEVGPFITQNSCTTGTATALSVAGDSAAEVRADYNAVQVGPPNYVYAWAGATYPTLQEFQAGTGQGAHDVPVPNNADGGGTPGTAPPENSPLIDSADTSAPGQLGTDINGLPYVDDPLVANTGTGSSTADRGASERQDSLSLNPVFTPNSEVAPAPFLLSMALDPATRTAWGAPVAYTVDFADGGGPVPVTANPTTHTFQTPGGYVIRVTATATGVPTQTDIHPVGVVSADPNAPTLTAGPQLFDIFGAGRSIVPVAASFTIGSGGSGTQVTNNRISFGDGTSVDLGPGTTADHLFAGPGTYTATLAQTDIVGRVSTATTQATVGDEYLPVAGGPIRVTDTRGHGQIPAHGTLTVDSHTMQTALAGVDAVVLGVTAVNAKANGYIGVYPHGNRGSTSNLNFAAGQVVANQVTVPPSPSGVDGMVDFFNGSGQPVDLLVDVYGFQTHGESGNTFGNTYGPHAPQRILDTRSGLGVPRAPVPGRGSVTVAVAGTNGVPADATSVLLNVTATHTNGAGYLTAYGHGSSRPNTSNSNWSAGQTVATLVKVPLTDGRVVLYNGSGGTADFVADLVGYDYQYGLGSVFLPEAPPQRALDTRTGATPTKLAPGHRIKVQLGGLYGMPAVGLSAAVLNLTVTHTTSPGYLTVYPDGGSAGGTSSLNYAAGSTVANTAVPMVGADGAVDVFNGGSTPVDVIVDLYGAYYAYPPG